MAQRTADRLPVEERVERRLRMTYDKFLAWGGSQSHAEWVDGEVIVFVPPGLRHQRIVAFLGTLLGLYARRLGLGEVLPAPFEMRLPGSAREPDILFIDRDHLDRLTEQRLVGPADLVVEVVSPDSAARDRRDKLAEYAAAGIPEYWLLDPRPGRESADFYGLDEDGTYRLVALDADGRYRARVLPGFWLRPDWLWRDPLPDAMDVLLEIAPEVAGTRGGHGPAAPGRTDPGGQRGTDGDQTG